MKRIKKAVMAVLVFAAFSGGGISAFATDVISFANLTAAISAPGYQLDIKADITWDTDTGLLSAYAPWGGIGAGGTIVGHSGNDFWTLDGAGFSGFANSDFLNYNNSATTFSGNLIFKNFDSFPAVLTHSAGANFNGKFQFNNNGSLATPSGAIAAQDSVITFTNSLVIFDGNKSQNIGGAISMLNGAEINFIGSTVNFINNSGDVSNTGGAIYLDGFSGDKVTFTNSSVTFSGNKKVSINSDIYSDVSGASATFDNTKVTFGGGISGAGDFIFKGANGFAEFLAGSVVNMTGGEFKIEAGTVQFQSTTANLNDVIVEPNGTLSLTVDYSGGGGTSVLNINGVATLTGSSLFIDVVGGTPTSPSNDETLITGLLAWPTSDFANVLSNYDVSAIGGWRFLWDYDGINAYYYGKLRLMNFWDDFVYRFQNETGTIDLDKNITAAASSDSFSIPNNDNITVNGNGYTIDSNLEISRGITLYSTSMTFKDAAFIQFVRQSGSGGVINAYDSQITILNSDFNQNTAEGYLYGGANGGVISANTSQITILNSNFNQNTVTNNGFAYDASGGAIYISSSGVSAQSSIIDTNFTNNVATTSGGAIYMGGTIEVLLKAQNSNSNVLFEDNSAGGIKNDIFLADTAALELNAAISGSKITMNSGIQGDNTTTINKTGSGDLVFNSPAVLDYAGGFTITAGTAKLLVANSTIAVLNVAAGGKLSFAGASFSQHKLFVNSASISGALEIGLDLSQIVSPNTVYDDTDAAADYISATGAITINSGSILNILTLGTNFVSTGSVKIMYAGGGITGDISFSGGGYDSSKYLLTSDGYNLVLNVLSNPTPPPLSSNSGKFLANALSLSAKSRGLDDLYNRLNAGAIEQKGTAWLGFYGSGYEVDKFKVSGFGGAAGADLYKDQNLMGGLFVRYGSNNLKEDGAKGTFGETEIGLYGAVFGLFEGKFNLKGNLSGAFQKYTIESSKDIDIDSKALKGGVELEYANLTLTPTIKINPFVAVQGGYAANEKADLGGNIKIAADNTTRLDTKIGVGLNGKLGALQNLNWYGRLYADILVSGDEPTYEIQDASGNKVGETKGTSEGAVQGAISVGADYGISEAISIFVNIGADFGEGFGYTGGIGANYKF